MDSKQSYKIKNESYAFGLLIIKAYTYLKNNKEFVLSKQLLRSGTSVGANVAEAQDAQSRKDFLHKMNIALKEAKETQYWISLLTDSGFFEKYDSISIVSKKCDEMVGVITKIVASIKKKQ